MLTVLSQPFLRKRHAVIDENPASEHHRVNAFGGVFCELGCSPQLELSVRFMA